MASFTRFITLLVLLSILWPMIPAQASPELPTIDLEIGLSDISKVQIGFHHSSFESTHSEYDLSVQGSRLSDGTQTIPLAVLSPLLKHLHGLYPSTRRLSWLKWTDDYPRGWVYLYLKDGRIIAVASESQYRNMLPWNVMVFENEQATAPSAVYVLLNPELPAALSAIWEPLTGSKYPRGDGDEDHWSPFDELSRPEIETAEFYSAGRFNWDEPASDQAEVMPWNPAALQPFVPLLARNAEIDRLFRSGFTLFDADFTVTVSTEDFRPQQYAGMFALRSPDSKDAVVSTVSVPIDPGEPVVTALTASQAEQLIAGRKNQPYLERASALLPSLVFLLDTRTNKPQPNFPDPEYTCVENSTFAEPAEILPALLHLGDYTQLNFFHFPEQKAWSVDLDIEKGNSNWDEATVKAVLEQWFPPEFATLAPEDLQKVSTHWGIAFNPGVTIDRPDLLARIQINLPPEVKIHMQNPEKDGDYTYLSLEGRPIIGETGGMQQLIHCGKLIPKWVTAPYPIDKIPLPNNAAPRSDLFKPTKGRTGWGSLWFTTDKRRFASITGSADGYVYLVWSTEDDKFYYAEGWANGAGWTEPLDLGTEGWSPDIYSFPNGEVHILWPELNPDGSVHLWRSKDQQWHKAERWPEMGYFQKIIQDSNGRLHMIWKGTDGLDQELMYAEWDAENGLSQPENISRRIGGIGNVDVDLVMGGDGKFCAAWGHTLEQRSSPDAVTGEIADISGVFFACRRSDGHWDMPEQIGQLAPYAHAVQVAIDSQGTPLVAWLSDEGLVSRRRVDGAWQDVQLIATVQAPETPAEFGPERAVRPTADVLLAASPDGKIFAGWSTAAEGIQLSIWNGSRWETPLPVMSIPSTEELTGFTMALDKAGRLHLVYFKGAGLTHAVYENGNVLTEKAGDPLGGYGSITPQLTIAGDFLYVIGDPKNSRFYTYIPPNSALPTPMPTPTRTPKVTPTLRPTHTPLPSSTPQPSATAAPTASPAPKPVQQEQKSQTTFWWGIGGAGLVVIAWLAYRSRGKDQSNTNG